MSLPIDVGVVHEGVAFYLGGIVGVGLWNVDGEFKASGLVQAVTGGDSDVESHEVVLIGEVDDHTRYLFHFADI